MDTVLVTGGAGYVGSHICKMLAAANYRPLVYDNLTQGRRSAVQWGPLEVGDVADQDRLVAVIRRHRPTAVLHMAAYIAAGESVAEPGAYYRNNVGGTLCLLDAMRACGLDCLVFSSTAAVYGDPESVPIAETHPLRPASPYGWSKLMVEQILADYTRAHGLRWVAMRYFNAAGADHEGRIGECHEPETHLVPLALQAALGKRRELFLFGTDYETADGTAVRDYVHVGDIAAAHIAALDYIRAGGAPTPFNLGTGRGHSVREVIASAERVTGKKVPVQLAARRPGDPAVLVADADAARRILGWAPRVTVLDEIIATAWRWEQNGRESAR